MIDAIRRYGRRWFLIRWLPLEISSWIIPLGMFNAGINKNISGLVFIAIQLVLLAPSYHRLKDAGLSPALLFINFVAFQFGPSWNGLGFTTLYLSQVIYYLIPLLCIFVPGKALRYTKTASAT